jgi:hypothetical protein
MPTPVAEAVSPKEVAKPKELVSAGSGRAPDLGDDYDD